jgi:hypothetical protein
MQAVDVEIKDFRYSLVWALSCLEPAPGSTSPFANRGSFDSLFTTAQKDGAAQELSPPWPSQKAFVHRFWCNYLRINNPSLLDSRNAWTNAVPLRAKAPLFSVTPGKFPGTIVSEHYYYPFGIAFILTFYGSGSFSGSQWVAAIQSAARDELLVCFGSHAPAELPVAGLAAETLERMRERYFGPRTGASPVPFTIATVIRGKGAVEDAEPEEGKDLHRWLFGVTTGQSNWQIAKLDDMSLTDCALTIRKAASPGDVVFATPRGRAIWIPSGFAHPRVVAGDRTPQLSMSCYHRNQLFAALQTESLCSLAKAIVDRISTSPNLPPRLDEFGRIATRTLIDLDGGDKAKTYRSISVHQPIKDLAPDIERLRQRYGI